MSSKYKHDKQYAAEISCLASHASLHERAYSTGSIADLFQEYSVAIETIYEDMIQQQKHVTSVRNNAARRIVELIETLDDIRAEIEKLAIEQQNLDNEAKLAREYANMC